MRVQKLPLWGGGAIACACTRICGGWRATEVSTYLPKVGTYLEARYLGGHWEGIQEGVAGDAMGADSSQLLHVSIFTKGIGRVFIAGGQPAIRTSDASDYATI